MQSFHMSATKHLLTTALVFALGLSAGAQAAESSEIIALRTKAVRGNPVAQYNLGKIYAEPKTANTDKAEAYVWFQIAQEGGATGTDLARLVDSMTPAELAEGKRRLDERKAMLTEFGGASQTQVQAAPAAKQTEPGVDEARAIARDMALKNQQLEDIAAERGRALEAAKLELEKLKAGASAPRDQALVAMTAEKELLEKQLLEAQEKARRTADLPERVARAERDTELLRTQNAQLGASLKEAQEKLASQATTAPAADELAVARERLVGEQKRTEELTASAAKLALDNERLRQELEAKSGSAELETLKEANSALHQRNQELVRQLGETEAKLSLGQTQTEPSKEEELTRQLEEANGKLATSLRSYTLLQQELDDTRAAAAKTVTEYEARIVSEREQAVAEAQKEITQLRATGITQGQESLALRDQLRQTQAQYAVLAEENASLRTRLALAGSSAGAQRPHLAPASLTLPSTLQAPTQPAAQPAAQGRQHIISEGDTLSRIARRYYGNPDRWPEIYEANRAILSDPGRLPKGAALRIP